MSPNHFSRIYLTFLVNISAILTTFSQSWYLEHANAYVRISAAIAIASAVENWPQVLHDTLLKIQTFYREKASYSEHTCIIEASLITLQAKIIAPEYDEYVRDLY
jgi:hypothetical protein